MKFSSKTGSSLKHAYDSYRFLSRSCMYGNPFCFHILLINLLVSHKNTSTHKHTNMHQTTLSHNLLSNTKNKNKKKITTFIQIFNHAWHLSSHQNFNRFSPKVLVKVGWAKPFNSVSFAKDFTNRLPMWRHIRKPTNFL